MARRSALRQTSGARKGGSSPASTPFVQPQGTVSSTGRSAAPTGARITAPPPGGRGQQILNNLFAPRIKSQGFTADQQNRADTGRPPVDPDKLGRNRTPILDRLRLALGLIDPETVSFTSPGFPDELNQEIRARTIQEGTTEDVGAGDQPTFTQIEPIPQVTTTNPFSGQPLEIAVDPSRNFESFQINPDGSVDPNNRTTQIQDPKNADEFLFNLSTQSPEVQNLLIQTAAILGGPEALFQASNGNIFTALKVAKEVGVIAPDPVEEIPLEEDTFAADLEALLAPLLELFEGPTVTAEVGGQTFVEPAPLPPETVGSDPDFGGVGPAPAQSTLPGGPNPAEDILGEILNPLVSSAPAQAFGT